MLKLLEIIIIAAAVDGKIDKAEQDAILRTIDLNNRLAPVTLAQLKEIQEQLIQRFRNGETRQNVIKEAANLLGAEDKLIAYATSIEIVMVNNEFTQGEAEYLKEQRELMGLDPTGVEKIHFAATLRYGRLIQN